MTDSLSSRSDEGKPMRLAALSAQLQKILRHHFIREGMGIEESRREAQQRVTVALSEQQDIYRDLWERFVSLQSGDATLLVKDAARYRWLRDSKADGTWARIVDNLHGDKWDDAIDAALSNER